MAMTWHNQDDIDYPNHKEDGASFHQHDDSMKKFAHNHRDWEAAALAKIEQTVDYFTLLPVRRVNLDRISPN